MDKKIRDTLFATSLAFSASNWLEAEEILDTLDYTNWEVSSLLQDSSTNYNYYETLISQYCEIWDNDIESVNWYKLFPEQVSSIWLERMSKALLWNVKYWWLDVIHPLFVDYSWQTWVNCANKIKSLISYSKNPNNRSLLENSYINKLWVDAWELPDELSSNGLYYQFFDLMDTFDPDKIGEREVIKDRENYNQQVLQIWNHLKNNWTVWSLMYMYFTLSNYKLRTKEYNEQKLEENPNANTTYNTHQAIFLWNGEMNFQASEISHIVNWKKLEMVKELDIIKFLINFIQSRIWYKSGLTNQTRVDIYENLKYFFSLIDIEINWKKIDLFEEVNKDKWDRFLVSPDDKIRISGPMLMDGFHDSNSDNKYISQNNHTRVMFYFEFILLETYKISELQIPHEKLIDLHWEEWKYDYITSQLEITNLFHLWKDEKLSFRLKEAILRYKFWLDYKLEFDEKEIELLNEINSLDDGNEKNSLNFQYISYRERKIENLISNLDKNEQIKFEREYSRQIQWLQLMWYIQSERELNPWTLNINAPIPLFNTDNIPNLHAEYIEKRKEEINESYINNIKGKEKNIYLYFFPWDNFWKIYSQLELLLEKFKDNYPSFNKLQSLDLLKRKKFIDIIIDRCSNDKDIDLTRWKIPSMEWIYISVEFIDEVLKWLLEESYVKQVKLSELDSMIIETIAKNKEDYDILAHILVQESYENWIPLRKLMKEIWRVLWKVSSYWDFQLRLSNLRNMDNSLIKLPNVEQLQRAIWYLSNPEIQSMVERRKLRYKKDIEKDLKIVEKIKEKIEYVRYLTEQQRLNAWKEIYELLKDLFRFNDLKQINIVWKVVQTSLILDKIHEHFFNLNGWLLASGVHSDEVLYNEDLQTRYKKLLLVINNRSEKTTLIWTWENYILRILESFWQDINSEEYPKLKRDFKWKIYYNSDIVKERLDFYISKFKSLEYVNPIFVKELISLIENIKESNLSAIKYYELFRNDNIKEYLASQWFDTYLLPTKEEFTNTAFRELFYDYAKTPIWMEPPKNWNEYKETFIYSSTIWLLWSILWFFWIKKKLKNRKKKNQAQ